jgi:hypothetical protein
VNIHHTIQSKRYNNEFERSERLEILYFLLRYCAGFLYLFGHNRLEMVQPNAHGI